MSEPSSKPPKKNRSLWRRFARLMLWALAALGVAVLLAWLVLQSDWLRERVRLAVEVQAGEALGRKVALGSVDFELFPRRRGDRRSGHRGP